MFSRTTEYALRAMACMAMRTDELMPTALLAKLARVPPNYLAKVLQQLATTGLITGRRGVGGGYKLAHQPGEIRLLDIINAIGEVKRIRECPLGLTMHEHEMCPLHKHADAAAKAIIDIYGRSTLQDLLSGTGPNRPLCRLGGGGERPEVRVSAERPPPAPHPPHPTPPTPPTHPPGPPG